MKRARGLLLFCLPALLSAFSAGGIRAGDETRRLERVNQALRIWLTRMEEDRIYLLIDRQESAVRLYHGRALLRVCPVQVDSLGEEPEIGAKLRLRIRRYRPSDPWTPILAGPFDWERNLAEEATDECALYFSNRVLIYASETWGEVRGPAVRIRSGDLRALYEACGEGTPLVVLPPGWNEEERDDR